MFSVFKNARFARWALGLGIDRLGNSIYTVAMPLLVYHTSSSVKSMAVVSVCQFLPRLIPGIYVGTIVDMFSKRAVFLCAVIFQSVISLLISFLYLYNLLDFRLLCIMVFCIDLGFEFSRTAEMTLVPVMFAEMRTEATAMLASIYTAMLMAGPVLTAFLLAVIGYGALIIINSFTYIAPVLVNNWSSIPDRASSHEGINLKIFAKINTYFFEILKEVYLASALKNILFFVMLISLATGGLELMIIFYLKNGLSASDRFTSLMMASGASGMFFGSFLVSTFKKIPRDLFLTATVIIMAAGALLLLTPNPFFLVCGQFFTFLGVFSCSVTQDIIIQENITGDKLGRLSGLMRIAQGLMISLSSVVLSSITAFAGFKGVVFFVLLIIIMALFCIRCANFPDVSG